MAALVRITLSIALLANLIAPQSFVRYSPCCYDAQGILTFNCPSDDSSLTSGISLGVNRSCCDPIKVILLGNPIPQLLAMAVAWQPDSDLQFDVTAGSHFESLAIIDDCAVATKCNVGLRFGPDILLLHSRLNL